MNKTIKESCPNCKNPDKDIAPMKDGSCGVCGGTGEIEWREVGRIVTQPNPIDEVIEILNKATEQNWKNGGVHMYDIVDLREEMRTKLNSLLAEKEREALNSYKAELVRRIDEEKIDKLFVQVSPVHMIGFDVAPTFNEALDRVKEIIN